MSPARMHVDHVDGKWNSAVIGDEENGQFSRGTYDASNDTTKQARKLSSIPFEKAERRIVRSFGTFVNGIISIPT